MNQLSSSAHFPFSLIYFLATVKKKRRRLEHTATRSTCAADTDPSKYEIFQKSNFLHLRANIHTLTAIVALLEVLLCFLVIIEPRLENKECHFL